ncbi:MAG: toll/interleukin-1 receptor domain-containing protein, partial [Blastocatellia bacterium]
ELIQDYVDGKRPRWLDFLTEVRFSDAPHPLMMMTAGKQDQSYVQRMQALDWKRLYDEHQLGSFLEMLRSEWKEAFDFVLIDSRTGITDIGGICTVQLPDLLMLLFTANLQSLRGSLDVVERAKRTRNKLPFDRAKLLVLPVATRFEMRVEYELAQQWLKTFATELRAIYSEWVHKDVAAEDLLNHTRVPYIPFWSFGEKLPVIEKGTDDPDDMGFSLETLAALVAQKFSYSDVLVRNRDSFVSAVKKRAGLNGSLEKSGTKTGPALRIFISYSHKDKSLLDELLVHLAPMMRDGMIEVSSDSQISAGESWEDALSARLEEADIILALISPDFLASKFVEIEMTRARQRSDSGEARVIPIVVRPSHWQNSPFARFQASPRDGKPVALWHSRDEAWLEVSQDIRKIVEEIIASRRLA